MGDILPFRRKEGEKPPSAYETIAWERAMEERKSTRPITNWMLGTKKKPEGVA